MCCGGKDWEQGKKGVEERVEGEEVEGVEVPVPYPYRTVPVPDPYHTVQYPCHIRTIPYHTVPFP